ncbi:MULTISPECIES: sulfatase-like hydrolase/transferase [unclassified Caulobacter]|uniref:sulfatase-like hydrolase/transferase n=1 Tax=unclassified Caulobacter TaxID=2648921 RepID=UPI000D3B3222|nr:MULTISPECIES: sulfatase-like hydrolase/transferase [unclassified Caulobacter]PTS88674.1 sulfatase [Caulobacter sp. HMWF009]PTT05193.1 sulfatase [Caulobacter sp. HMWF025]
MRVLKWAGIVLGVLVALLTGAWLGRDALIYHIGRLMVPKGTENKPVAWQVGPAQPAAPEDQRPPNVIFILADDLGYNDVSLNGGGVGGVVKTPNIDSIAQEGVDLTNGYAGNATCSPSRAALMTGRYPTRFGFEFTPTPVGFSRLVGSFRSPGSLHPPHFNKEEAGDMPPMDELAVPTSEVTIAEVLKTRGYHTVHLGKWHLGGSKGSRPEDQGFDESLGFIAGASMFLPENDPNVENSKQAFDPIDKFLWANLPYTVQYNGQPMMKAKGFMTDYLSDEAIKSIKANRNQPFFMYLAYNAPHTPLQAPKADYDALPQIKDHRLRVYGAMVRNLDRNVGRVLQTLKDEGLDDNTLVVFTSDNGGAHYIGLPHINSPYRGWKATFFEGGLRVPYYMKWPKALPAGTRFNSPVGHIDMFATAAGAAGATMPNDRPIDGVNLTPYLTGQAQGRPHEALFWRSGDARMVRAGDWKLQLLKLPDQQGEKVWLYDLASDPTEQKNLATSNPAKVAELRALLVERDKTNVKAAWPSLLRGAIAIDHPLNVPDKPTDEFVYWNN